MTSDNPDDDTPENENKDPLNADTGQIPNDHPLNGREHLLDTHAGHLQAFGDIFTEANPENISSAMIVLCSKSGIDTLPTVNLDTDPRTASMLMLGTHIHHVAASMQQAGVQMTMEDTAVDAINYVRQHGPSSNDTKEESAQTKTPESVQIGELYSKALANYDDLGTFQLALSNAMSGRSYEWDQDEFKTVLKALVKFSCSTSTPRDECPDEWDEYMNN